MYEKIEIGRQEFFENLILKNCKIYFWFKPVIALILTPSWIDH